MRAIFATLVVLTLLTVALPPTLAQADLSQDVANKYYNVRFKNWVAIMLNAKLSSASEYVNIIVREKVINDRVRFVVNALYVDNEAGRRWYVGSGSRIEELIKLLCNLWTEQGYPISLNDFEIDIRVFP